MRTRRAVAVAVARPARVLTLAALAVAAGGCKRNKPPPTDRVWLGPAHACVLERASAKDPGALACWGRNDRGELADGTRESRPLAARAAAAGSERPSELTLGAGHTCGVFAGRVRCWGAHAAFGGELDGVTSIASAGERVCAVTSKGLRCAGSEPETFRGGAVTLLGGGGSFFCARTEPLAVRCERAPSGASPPAAGELLAGAEVVGLTTGAAHACAVLRDGSVSCWGDNADGQIGDGTTTPTASPAVVHGLAAAASVHAGTKHTCARLRSNTVACWGANNRSQLANGTTEAGLRPAVVPGLHGVVELAVAGDSACARLMDGSIRCWGDNASGQLGSGTTLESGVPMPIRWRAPGVVAAGRGG